MIIKVTQYHINKGIWQDSENCPIALACKSECQIMENLAFIKKNKGWAIYKLSKLAKKFIEDFDNGKLVKPQKFNLRFWKIWKHNEKYK